MLPDDADVCAPFLQVELSDSQVDAEGMAELKNKLDADVNDHDSRHDLALALFGSQVISYSQPDLSMGRGIYVDGTCGDVVRQRLEILRHDAEHLDTSSLIFTKELRREIHKRITQRKCRRIHESNSLMPCETHLVSKQNMEGRFSLSY